MKAKKEVAVQVEQMVTFSDEDRGTLARCTANIVDAQTRSEGLAETIAANLWKVNQKQLFKIDEYDTVHDWAMARFEISKGTVSDSINTFERFGNKELMEIDVRYAQYKFSTLMRMKKLSDKDIEDANILPDDSRATVMDKISRLGEVRKLQDKKPQLFKNFTTLYKALVTLVGEEDALLAAEKAIDRKIEGFSVNDFTAEELDILNEYVVSVLDELAEDADEEQEDDNAENAEETYVPTSNTSKPSTPSTDNKTEDSAPHTFPTKSIQLGFYLKQDGSIDKKAFLNAVWDATQGVYNREHDLIITCEGMGE